MFDFANQAYTLLIITVIFGDVFTRLIVGESGPGSGDYRLGNLLWSVALGISYFLVVVTNPMAGAIMDSSRLKKTFLFMSYLACVISTALLWLVQPGWIIWAMALIVVSNYAYAMGESFIASFLPGLGPSEDLGFISGLGWALGYVGGLVATVFALGLLGEVSQENFEKIRWVGPLAAIFFLFAALPTFVYVKDRTRHKPKPNHQSYWQMGVSRLRDTQKNMHTFKDLRFLMWSIFFMMAGLYIVISFAFIYGAQVIGWDESVRVLMFVTVQLSATLGAFVFGLAHQPWGAKKTYQLTLWLWLVAIVMIWQTPTIGLVINHVFLIDLHPQYVFLVAGLVAGLSLGASQSAGRALVGVLTPRGKAAEFFGFWGTVSKAAALVGILGLGILQAIFGLANAIVFCLIMLLMGLVFAQQIDLERGLLAAKQWRSPELK